MRFIYVDEAGTSIKERVSVVAGVIIHADSQISLLTDRLSKLVNDYVPEEHRNGYILHATQIFSGGKAFPRETYPPERRWELLEQILALPRDLNIPISIGYAERMTKLPDGITAKHGAKVDHLIAFIQCLAGADRFIREFFPKEVSTVVAEDNTLMRRTLKRAPDWLRGERSKELITMEELLPLKTVVGTIHFAEKREEPMLQLADACAFAAGRYLSGGSYGRRCYDALTGGLSHPTSLNFGKGPIGRSVMYWKKAIHHSPFINLSRSADIVIDDETSHRKEIGKNGPNRSKGSGV